MKSTIDLSLKRLVIYFIARRNWNKTEIKSKTKEFFKNEHLNLKSSCTHFSNLKSPECSSMGKIPESTKQKWDILLQDIMQKLNQEYSQILSINEIRSELMFVTKQIGLKIFRFSVRLNRDFQIHLSSTQFLNYIDNICWDNNGTIDLGKTFAMIWARNPKIDIEELASSDFDDKSISFSEICNELKINFVKYQGCALEHHFSVYERLYVEKNDTNSLDVMLVRGTRAFDEQVEDWHNPGNGLEYLTMFKRSVKVASPKSVKYFWFKLTDDRKSRYVVTYTMSAVSSSSLSCTSRIEFYCNLDQVIEICLFLISEMTNDQIANLFKSGETFHCYDGQLGTTVFYDFESYILKMMLNWPWIELFIPTIELIWLHKNELTPIADQLKLIVSEMKIDNQLCGERCTVYSKLFRGVWVRIPAKLKRKLSQSDVENLIRDLVLLEDLLSVELITHDSVLTCNRRKVVIDNLQKLTDLAMEDQFEKLDTYIAALTPLPDERRDFRLLIDPNKILRQTLFNWDKNRNNRQCVPFDLLDKFLLWQSSSLEERDELKKELDVPLAYHLFLRNSGYDLFQKFLTWKYPSEDDLKDCMNRLRNHRYTWDIIVHYLTMEEHHIGRLMLEHFLKWLLESDDEINEFRKEFTRNEEYLFPSLKQLIEKDLTSYKKIDKVFDWCSLSEPELGQLKENFFDKVLMKMADEIGESRFCDVANWWLDDGRR